MSAIAARRLFLPASNNSLVSPKPDIPQTDYSARTNFVVTASHGGLARKVSVPLSFLGEGSWTAKLWLDGAKPDAIRADSGNVAASGDLRLDLAADGGAVAVLKRR
jgi:hypothetical protein